MSRADGDVSGIRWSLEDLAELAAEEGDPGRASELYEEALSCARQIGDHHSIASILQGLGTLACTTGKHARAKELVGEGLQIMQQIGCKRCTAQFLSELAFVASAAGEPERTVRLLAAADASRERNGSVVPATSVGGIQEALGAAHRRLGEAAYAAAWSEGRAMSFVQRILPKNKDLQTAAQRSKLLAPNG